MSNESFVRRVVATALVICGSLALTGANAADIVGNEDIARVWSRLDQPVQTGAAMRTWFWGPEPIGELHEEYYADAPGGKRPVIYFDKTRMEINVNAESGTTWRVTNGLLATELITGQVQLGDEAFVDVEPAEINAAGDPDDPNGPTYRSLSRLLDADALPEGTTITQTVARSGEVGADFAYNTWGVTAEHYVPETGHTVASVFWEYINGSGMIYLNGEYQSGPLFEHHVYGVGYPITEAYWSTVRVAGEERPVLVQAFQRRVLTYTPNNPDGWEVEAGNVGRHYRDWRASLGDLVNPDQNLESPSSATTSGSDDSGDDERDECDGSSVNEREDGAVNQSNTAIVDGSGDGDQSISCTQENIVVTQ